MTLKIRFLCCFVVALTAWIMNSFMDCLNMFIKITGICKLVVTLIAGIPHSFMTIKTRQTRKFTIAYFTKKNCLCPSTGKLNFVHFQIFFLCLTFGDIILDFDKYFESSVYCLNHWLVHFLLIVL